ncbi:hypothetical protein [Aquabacterium sp.]|uniref:hypothetical protein n=1 Tax=Aquabacterium sp. TaxID=1872578 RepID=UPI004037C650
MNTKIKSRKSPKGYDIPKEKGKFNSSRESLSIKDKFNEHQGNGYKLYEMSLTYKPFTNNRSHSIDEIRKIFIQFYLHNFLGDHIFKNRHWMRKSDSLQPHLYCFVEEHESIRKALDKTSGIYRFPERLHHHAVMAAHPETVQAIDLLIGEGTLLDFHSSIMTSSLTEADSDWALYATKNYSRHEEDWMIFGPRAE